MKIKKLNQNKNTSILSEREMNKVIIGNVGVGKASWNTLSKVEDLIKS